MNESGRLYRFLSFLHTFSVWLLFFLAGAMVIRYNLPPSRSLMNGFIALEAWAKAWEESASDKAFGDEVRADMSKRAEELLAKAKVRHGTGAAQEGYTLLTVGYMPYPVLVDMEGKIRHRWDIDTNAVWGSISCTNMFRAATPFVNKAYVYPNGDVLAQYADHGSPYGCGMIRADKDAKVRWAFSYMLHHDFVVDASGDIYALGRHTVTEPLAGYEGLTYPLGVDEVIKIGGEDGQERFRFTVLEAFLGTPYELMVRRGKGDGDDEYDFLHTNSVDVLRDADAKAFPQFNAGDILISIRAMNIIAVISAESKKVIWAYEGFWRFQHAASFLPNGHILLLDNQGHMDFGKTYSRAIELDPQTLAVAWAFVGDKQNGFITEKAGRVQRLPGGNTLAVDSQHARVLEIGPKGEIVWEYQLESTTPEIDYTDAIYHAERYDAKALPFLSEKEAQ